jgi:hypothetical protein
VIVEELERRPKPHTGLASALARGVLAREDLKQREGGSLSAEEARRLLSGDVRVSVVVAPDPWGPVKGKGFVRARQVMPFVLSDAPVDVIELDRGGVTGRVRRGVSPSMLARWMLRREAVELLHHGLRMSVDRYDGGLSPIALAHAFARLLLGWMIAPVTLARCLSYVARTELRARRDEEAR